MSSPSTRSRRPVAAARLALAGALALAALATGWPLAGRLFAAAPAPGAAPAVPLPLDGSWQTLANGDRVNRLLRDGDTAWAATAGGGLVRWDLAGGGYRQFLAPQDGLPDNTVNDLARGADGALWLGTERGLARLDPATGAIRAYTPETSPGMPVRVVRALQPAPDGTLWVGLGQEWDAAAVDPVSRLPGTFKKGGLARFDPASGAWTQLAHAEPLSSSPIGGEETERFKTIPSENITALALGSDGILWVGTVPYYVFERATCPVADPSCAQGGSWVLAGGGLAANQGDAWANWLPSDAEQSCFSNHVTDLAADIQGRMWVATAGRGLLLMKNGLKRSGCRSGGQPYWVRPTRNRPGPRGNYVWAVDVADDGRVWIGQGEGPDDGLGVGVLNHAETFDTTLDDSWEFLDLDDGPVETRNLVTALAVAGTGPRLMGTRDEWNGDGAGLRAYEPVSRRWRPLRTADNGLPSNLLTDIVYDEGRDALWFAFAKRGVARLDAGGWRWWRSFGRDRRVALATVEAAAGEGRVAVDLADQAAFDAAFPRALRYVRFGEDPTLYRLTRSAMTSVGGLRYLDVTPKLVGRVPAGTAVYNVARGPASDAVTSLALAADGGVWAGASPTAWLGANCPGEWGLNCWLDGGLAHHDGGSWTVWDEHTPNAQGQTVPDQAVQSVALDPRGQVWVGTGDRGLAQGAGIGVLDPASGTWSVHPATRFVAFAGMGISALDADPVSGDMWVAHHAAEDCVPNTGGTGCHWVRYGGGVSRWNGARWDIWQKPAAPLAAFGLEGEVSSILVDRPGGRVWAGAWDAVDGSFHWGAGIGINAALSWCPLDCGAGAWQSRVWPNDGEVVALALDDDAHLWAGTHRSGNGITPPEAGVKVFDGSAWTTYKPENSGLPSREITTLARAGERMWVGTRRHGASRYSRYIPPTPTPPPTDTPTATATVQDSPTPSPSATPSAATATGRTPTASATPSATATARDTGEPPRVTAVYLPFAYQPTRCRTCPTPTARPRPTATASRVPGRP